MTTRSFTVNADFEKRQAVLLAMGVPAEIYRGGALPGSIWYYWSPTGTVSFDEIRISTIK